MSNQNAGVYSGDYLELTVPVRDPAGGPIAYEGVTASYKLAKTRGGVSMCIEATVSEKDSTLHLSIVLTPEITSSLAGTYYHEVEVIDSSQRRFTVLTGTLSVIPTLSCPEV